MTRTADDLIPENYENWPRSIQRKYWTELHALYFPEEHGRAPVQQAAVTVTAHPGDDDIPEAEIVDGP